MTREQLLSKINQVAVWSYILKENIWSKKQVLNVLRGDKHLGSCYIKQGSRDMVMVDYAAPCYNGFDCVMAYQHQNPHLSWNEVCIDLLKITGNIEYKWIEQKQEKKIKVEFDVHYRDWNYINFQFWKDINVSRDQLDNPLTFTRPFKNYDIYKDGMYHKTIKGYGYAYHVGDKVKCYIPDGDKFTKWRTNFEKGDVWYVKRNSDTLLLCKSNKCLLVWENLVPFDLVNYLAEGSLPTIDFVNTTMIKYKRIISIRDNDLAGLRVAGLTDDKEGNLYNKKQKKLYGSLEVENKVIPLWTGHKDVAELVRWERPEDVKKIINSLFLINL